MWSTDSTTMSVWRVDFPEVLVDKWGVWDSELPKCALLERVLWVCEPSDVKEGVLSVEIKVRLGELLAVVVACGWVLWNVEACMVSVDKSELWDPEPSDDSVKDRVVWDDKSWRTAVEVWVLLGEMLSVVVTWDWPLREAEPSEVS